MPGRLFQASQTCAYLPPYTFEFIWNPTKRQCRPRVLNWTISKPLVNWHRRGSASRLRRAALQLAFVDQAALFAAIAAAGLGAPNCPPRAGFAAISMWFRPRSLA